jgi:hypothetical protein
MAPTRQYWSSRHGRMYELPGVRTRSGVPWQGAENAPPSWHYSDSVSGFRCRAA